MKKEGDFRNALSQQRSIGTAYALLFLFGFFGIHRIYIDPLENFGYALLSLSTIGLASIFCVGSPLAILGGVFLVISALCTFMDIFRIPHLVKTKNAEILKKYRLTESDLLILK